MKIDDLFCGFLTFKNVLLMEHCFGNETLFCGPFCGYFGVTTFCGYFCAATSSPYGIVMVQVYVCKVHHLL